MNTKYMLTLIASFLAGGVAGFLLSRTLLEEKYAEIAEEEIDSMKKYYMGKVGEKILGTDDFSEEERDEHRSKVVNFGYASSLDGTMTAGINEKKRSYTLKNSSDEDKEEVPECYIINEESFSEEYLEYEKIGMIYYVDSQTLVDEDGDPVKDILGYADLISNGVHTITDAETIYIRDEKFECDMEITIDPGSYYTGKEMLTPREAQEKRTRQREEEEGNG